MPIIEVSTYKAPPYLFNGHMQTIFPHFFRPKRDLHRFEDRIDTADGDFLDLDWYFPRDVYEAGRPLVIISHGLEGSSRRGYVLAMVNTLKKAGYDVLAWNYRGCSGRANRKIYSYHSGKTEDLEHVIEYALDYRHYKDISLVGFSLGGNITLKYLGEQTNKVPPEINHGVAISAPVDLRSSAEELALPQNRIYLKRFLEGLYGKILEKNEMFPGQLRIVDIKNIKDFKDFDDLYTAPLNGFADAYDYWKQCSSLHKLANIEIPTLLLNAVNDSFLGAGCYPCEQAKNSEYLYLEMPETGGHTGFYYPDDRGIYWSEKRVLSFLGRR